MNDDTLSSISLKDSAAYAKSKGKSYAIVTNEYTKLSTQLKELSKQLDIYIKSQKK